MKKYQYALWTFTPSDGVYDDSWIPSCTGRLNCETIEKAASRAISIAAKYCDKSGSTFHKLTVQCKDGKTVLELDISTLRRYDS